MPAPDFLVIGAQKGGTTWLRHHLRAHPAVFMPESEVHYFDKAHHFSKGRDWYESHFRPAAAGQTIGEKTPDYLWTTRDGAEGHRAGAHERIHELYPETKLIVTLRNPVNRAVSALNHLIRTGRISPLRQIDELLFGDAQSIPRAHGVIEKGDYFRQLQSYFECFDREQVLVLLFEDDVLGAPQQTLRRLYEFIGVEADIDLDEPDQERGRHRLSLLGLLLQHYVLPKGLARLLDRPLPATKRHPSPDGVLRLYDRYQDENEKLFDLIGRQPASWRRTTAPPYE
jgi:hypothetical protein